MKKWQVLGELKEFSPQNLVKVLLQNRKITEKEETEEFLNPDLSKITQEKLGIDKEELEKAVKRIRKAIKEKELIVIFGDYDVDGICGSAILWESLRDLGANVMPYIPHRIDEGYGLSIKGVENLLIKYPEAKLIVTIDNGIVANKAVENANEKGLEVIITDHHVPSTTNPKAHAIVHSTMICGAGVGWFLTKQLEKEKDLIRHIELVAIATIADVMPLTHFNRTLAKLGIEELRKTKRIGLLALFKAAGIKKEDIGTYEIGHMISPRINAMGRIEHAIDSLRLLCTPVKARAEELALKLNQTNMERQKITLDALTHAKKSVDGQTLKKLLFIYHESYQPGVIGLVAGRLVEEFYRPTIVLSKGDVYSKASARSVFGFNIINFIRTSSDLLADVGGHPMAAGFTVETKNLLLLQKALEDLSEKEITDDMLVRLLKIDCELPIANVDVNLYNEIQKLFPFGQGNPEPVFMAKDVVIEKMHMVGAEKKHLKLNCSEGECNVDAIAFSFQTAGDFKIGDRVDIVYTITNNDWNGKDKVELKIKDMRKS